MESVLSDLLRTFGLTGNGAATSSLTPTPKSPQALDNYANRYADQGQVSNPDIWSAYSTMMRRPVTFDSQLQLWDEMAGWDLMAAALVEIVEEAIQTDEGNPYAIQFECNDSEFEEELNLLAKTLDFESIVPSQVWHVAGFGNHFEKVDYIPGEGVTGLSFIHPMDCRRYWLERTRQCIGFRWAGRKPDKESAYAYADGMPIERAYLSADSGKTEALWYPWEIMHLRRLYRMRFTEHGEPIFDEAQQIYKKLRMSIDQMVVHRAQVQPDRYVVNIDVQELPPRDQMATVQRWKQTLRSKLSMGGTDSSQPGTFKSFYNPWALDTVLYMARPKGFTSSIDKLQGTATVPDVYDIELLQNLFFSILGMPKWWIMGQSGQQQAPSGKALLASDIRFLRKVKAIRKPVMQGYTWLAYFHALLKKKDLKSLDIKAIMPPIGSLEDQQKMEVLKGQTEVLAAMAQTMNDFQLPREAWIDIVFRRYLHLPDDVVNVFLTALPPETEGGQMESEQDKESRYGKVRARSITSAVIAEMDQKYGREHPSIKRAIKTVYDALDGKIQKENTTQYRSVAAVLGLKSDNAQKVMTLQEGQTEYIRSSYQQDQSPIAKVPGDIGSAGVIAESKTFDRRSYYGPK